MKITLTYNGVLEIKPFDRGTELELPEGTTVEQVLDLCEIQKNHQAFVLASVAGKELKKGSVLHDGDTLMLFLPLGGG